VRARRDLTPIRFEIKGQTSTRSDIDVSVEVESGVVRLKDRANAAPERSLKLTGRLHRAGVPLVAGSDLVLPGHSIFHELELPVRAGLSPLEAIRAATLVPARASKLEAELGAIEAGKRADLILVAGNPLDSISHIRRVKYVVARGQMYDCAALRQSVGFRP
jgi:imidazolonepropionase-like amidohydrolase